MLIRLLMEMPQQLLSYWDNKFLNEFSERCGKE